MPAQKKKSKKKSAGAVQPLYVVPPAYPPPGLTIVGVGASAGGLEAFTAVLDGLPPDPGVAIVFVQHLAPKHESALVPLLSGHGPLPIVQATQGAQLEANRIYVIPPNTKMGVEDSRLVLSARPDDRSQYTPIDTFLSSLADQAGPRAVGVILSGTASDGAHGIRDIKSNGGVTIVQSPESAKYDGMPRASIATAMVDLVLPPRDIGPKLAELARHEYVNAAAGLTEDLPVSEDHLQDIFDILRPVSGVDFRHYKLPTIRRRLFRRMALHRVNDVGTYVRLLRGDPAEVRNLYQDLLIHVTRFFREPESFAALAREVFPAIVDGRDTDRPIRAWVSGCATGEEAYSLAIAIVEFLQQRQLAIPVQIFATDVSETAVEHARAGVFAATIEGDVGADRLRRFFTRHDGSYRVTKAIRDLCVFARQDLTKDPPFSRLDLILCRNVLIYMDAMLQRKLLSVFHYALISNGFLVLGQAETVGAQAALFTLVDKKYRVHRKKSSSPSPAMSFPVDYSGAGVPMKKAHAEPVNAEKFLQTEVSRMILDRFSPPGVVVDSDMQVVQFRGQTGAYLEPAPGEASLNLLKMAKEGLLYGLRTAIHAARKTRDAVRKTDLQVRSGGAWKPVSIEVIPLNANGRLHYLVLFDDGHRVRAPRRKAEEPVRKISKKQEKSQVDFLRRELAASRDYLQSIIQELEAANEELQSANEEILSSNEELQSTNEELDTAKEELQSTNEELNTVNEELHARNEELSRLNSDLVNLLSSVQIAIVIVSADLRIRRFTPMAEKVLNLISADTDRQIGHINPNIVGANIEQLIVDCIDSISLIEREVQDRQGHWYSLRVRPYRSLDNKIDGAVLTLFDIDDSKRYEESIRAATAIADEILHAAARPVAVLDADLRIRSASVPFASLFGMSDRDSIRQRPLTDFVRSGDGLDRLRRLGADEGPPPEASTVRLEPMISKGTIELSVRVCPPYDRSDKRVLLLTGMSAPEPQD